MTFKAMLFDADGVVILPWRFRHYLEREHRITREMTRGFFNGVFNDCLEGRTDLKAVLPPFLAEWRWPESVDDFVATWLREEDAADERVMDAIARLRGQGIVCGLATSQERYRAEYMRTAMRFAGRFDRLFFSCELGCQKPDHAYYQHITRALGLPAGEILFWDDNAANVAAARECGWQAEVYDTYERFAAIVNVYAA